MCLADGLQHRGQKAVKKYQKKALCGVDLALSQS